MSVVHIFMEIASACTAETHSAQFCELFSDMYIDLGRSTCLEQSTVAIPQHAPTLSWLCPNVTTYIVLLIA